MKSNHVPTPAKLEMGLSFWGCIETDPFITAAGLPANRKVNLDKVPDYSLAFSDMVQGLVQSVAELKADMVAPVPNGANRFARKVAEELGIGYLGGCKEEGDFVYDEIPGKGELVVVEDVRSTGMSALKAAQALGIECVVGACSIVDRGIDVADVKTLDQARQYAESHPDKPPPHIEVPFPYDNLLSHPLPLLVRAGEAV